MTTGESLPGSEKVRKLQSVLHAKAKDEPGRRYHALIDKVWREDFLAEAWRRVRRNGGAAGVDAETFADIESYGEGRWLGELAREISTRSGGCVSGSVESTGRIPGITCASRSNALGQTTACFVLHGRPWAFRVRRHDLVRKPGAGKQHAGFDERG